MNLELYKTFYYVHLTGKISKAAELMYISQPAVSQSLKLLEESLGVKLFNRTSKGVTLTTSGEAIVDEVTIAIKSLEHISEKIKNMDELKSGDIRIGASDTICGHFLLPIVELFQKKYNNINIHILNNTSYEIIELMKNKKIDIGFVNLPINIEESLDIVTVKALQDCLVCGESYKHLIKHSMSLKEIAKEKLILLEKGSNMRTFLNGLFAEENIILKPHLELGSSDLLVKFASANFGLAFITKNFYLEQLENNKIFEVPLIKKIPPRGIGMVTHHNENQTKLIKTFIEDYIITWQ